MLPNLESAVATQVKISVFILIPKTDNAKECAIYCTVAIISHTSKVMFKILQASLQQRNQRSNYRHLLDHQKSKSFRKASTSASLTMLNHLCGLQKTMENSKSDGNTRSPDLPPEKSVCGSEKQQLELDVEQTGSKSGKDYTKAVYCHHAYLTYMRKKNSLFSEYIQKF